MQRRTVLAGTASILAAGGCLDVQSLEGAEGDGGSGDGEGGVGDGGDLDESGTIEVTVDGAPIDLAADRFQSEYADEDVRFHFHDGDDRWYMEGERVTFGRGIDLLPRFAYERDGDAHVVTVDGTTYDSGDADVEVAFRVDGEAVDPLDHAVRDGEHLVVEVTTGG